MSFKKTAAIVAAAGALTAVAIPAMAFENEFHGMYRAYGYMTNALSGSTTYSLNKNSATDKFIEQRARLQYIAKASDNLKLVTHFELDTKFGGSTGSKYLLGDGGNLDADRVTLETKNVYLDFNIPSTPVNAKVGVQPFSDSFGGLFGNFDATGVVLTGKFSPLTATYGYFTVGSTGTGSAFDSNNGTQDLNVFDLKFAANKNLTVGTSYYMLLDKTVAGGPTVVNNTVGLNAAGKFGPASLAANFGLQFGKENAGLALNSNGTLAMAASLAAKIAAGPGSVNLAALYLSGDTNKTGFNHGWQSINAAVNYFTPANMWLITRNAATINSSTAIGSTGADITRGGRGIVGLFAGYEGKAGKVFYNGNVGYARVAEAQNVDSFSIGTEINATVGYKLYDNMSAAFTGAYAFLGDGYAKKSPTSGLLPGGVADADNSFLTAIALNYSF